MRDVIVLAGGHSVQSYNLRDIEERGHLIAVNDSALYTKCDVAFTMDRLWIEGRQLLLKTLNPPEIWYRDKTVKNFLPPSHWHCYWHSETTEPTHMEKEPGKLNGSNSGTCALNLAFQRANARVFMLGFDMQRGSGGEKHWYPDYPWNNGGGTKQATLEEWAREFDMIASHFKKAGIQAFNVNHRSLISAFPVVSYTEFLRMTK